MSFSYYRCDWIHPENEDPVVVYYEVDDAGDVPRLIDVFANGRRQCMSVVDLALIGRDGRRIASLVEGSFYDGIAGMVDGLFFEEGQERISMTHIAADKFEIEWQTHRAANPEGSQ
ncbi:MULTISPECIES: DUF6881 domain-containing protein [Rhizobium]|uniref:DUF6881 domain-containing protein n=1 Tax=Rhizobium miluonense TaxID=411945 RepID=A0A1C3XCE5_9HYPH|nr:hypothetical protein [Rhizobium miluonense]SCB49970.1 hypothetical protein GA0061102_10811 [Rhizobium miluonense]